MVRVILAGLLVSCCLWAAPVGRAYPVTCPPTCDQIPATAWPAPPTLPLYPTSHWPPLAGLAVPAPQPRFLFEALCGTQRVVDDPRLYAVAATAEVLAPAGQWQLRAQILHWRGETWRGGELAISVFDEAEAAVRGCRELAPVITTAEDDRLAVQLPGPVIVRQYLLAHPQSSSVTELVFWVAPDLDGQPAVPWPAPADAQVFEAMATPLCEAYLSSCG
ncbi:MAG: ATPase [Mycobacterium sp.]